MESARKRGAWPSGARDVSVALNVYGWRNNLRLFPSPHLQISLIILPSTNRNFIAASIFLYY